MFKKSTLFFLLALITLSTFAQKSSNIIFFSSGGEKFDVVLNGARQNDMARTNVKVTDLNADGYEATIVFQDQSLGRITKYLMMPEMSSELTIRITKTKKGRYVMRYFGEVPLASAPAPAAGQYIVNYSPSPRPRREPVSETVQSTTTTITETTTTGDETAGGSINVNIGGNSVGIDVKVNDPMMDTNAEMSSSTTVTTTTTTTTSSSGFDDFDDVDVAPQYQQDDHYHMPGYSGRIGCSWPVETSSFEDIKRSIASKDFEDSKLTLAKQVLQSNCLLASQVHDIMELFDFEESRLTFAKLAYGHTFDQGNFYKVNDAFDFESSIDELNGYISAQH